MKPIRELQDLARLQSRMQRPAGNINNDGSFELGWGTMILCGGLVTYLHEVLPGSRWGGWLGMILVFCSPLAAFAIPKLIKRYFTWPRTGYVAQLNDIKLIQLVRLMALGATLGVGLTLGFRLASEIRDPIRGFGPQNNSLTLFLDGFLLLVCMSLAVYLCRKTITKRQLLPGGYDAAQINQQFKRTAAGRKILWGVKATLLLLFVGIPVLVGGVVFGLIYLSKSVTSNGEISFPQVGLLTFFVASNAGLYLMCNAVAIRQYPWKWLVLVVLALGPIGIALALPDNTVELALPVPRPVMLFLGLMWFVSGAATLVSFLRHNPVPSAEAA